MQSSAFSLSSSIPLLKSRNPRARSSTFRLDPICLSSSSKSFDLSSNNGVLNFASSSCKSSLSSSPSRFNAWSSVSSLASSDRQSGVVVKATSMPESASKSGESSNMMKMLQLGSLFGLWYLFNIYFNIYNNQFVDEKVQWMHNMGLKGLM